MRSLFTICGSERKEELREVFQNGLLHDWRCLGEYEAIVYIDWKEELHQSELRFWEENMSLSCLVSKLRILKHALKRIEYEADGSELEIIEENYSKYAISEVCERYIINKESVYKKFALEN